MIKSVTIIVATHKDYEFPKDDGYLPVQVGCALAQERLSICGDDYGENISHLNKSFCELTGLYWMWKNEVSDFYGLVHYRRYFRSLSGRGASVCGKQIAFSEDLAKCLENFEIILPKPRNYWIETVQRHYENSHNAKDLAVLEQVVADLYPSYSHEFSQVMERTSVCLYNMFLMRAELFHNYCQWLFSILFEIEKRIPYQSYGPYQGRVFGFLAERLLNVWVEKNFLPRQVKYLPVINIEGEKRFKKTISFLERKLTGVKQV